MNKFFFNITELLLTSYVVMLVAGAVGASLDWGTFSFLQTLGLLYIVKCVVSSATCSVMNTAMALFRTAQK